MVDTNKLENGIEQWKDKYYRQLDLAEQLEQSSDANEQSLRRGISRLSFAVHGGNADLTKAIKNLRSGVRNECGTDEIVKLIDDVCAAIRREEDNTQATEQPSALAPTPASALDISEVFIQFIEHLSVPQELQSHAHKIREKLLDGKTPHDYGEITKDVVELVAKMRSELTQEKDDLENFLRQLNHRLLELDQNLSGAQNHSKTSVEQGTIFGDVVQEKVMDIETTIHDAADLDHLKDAVQGRFNGLRTHIQEYRHKEKKRQIALESELSKLKQKLTSVEQETGKLRTRLEKQRQKSLLDPTTQIHNRLAFEERVKRDFAHWKRYRSTLSLIILDIDNFKLINDTYGHKAGDVALKYIAQLLQKNLRETDFIARYGGEEFVVLVPEASQKDLMKVAEKLRLAIEKCDFHHHNKKVPITISSGIACFSEEDTVDDVFSRADKALYTAKNQGRNRCSYETV